MTKIETARAKRTKLTNWFQLLVVVAAVLLLAGFRGIRSTPSPPAHDPGVREGAAGAGGPIDGLTRAQLAFFRAGKAAFEEEESIDDGRGPRFNFISCVGCHQQPKTGGTSPFTNPQFAGIGEFPGNVVPFFITENGPIREARFQFNPDGTRDGGVHNLFVIQRENCQLQQPDFVKEFKRKNLIFRIPTPLFGGGLIEQIPDAAIVANLGANTARKSSLGIFGRPSRISGDPNNNGNDGTIARFGWKAQNKSLLLFSGEAYNVEMGITNELFQTEREEATDCQFAPTPNDVTEPGTGEISDIEQFAFFARFLAPPSQSPDTPGGSASIANGRQVFADIGCALCHTPTLKTGYATVTALADTDVNLYSDLSLHQMGVGLADGIIQGQAQGNEFRTAPLWGLGQRIFFLHDGRTSDLIEAIHEHRSVGSEANKVVTNFNALDEGVKQNLLNFLRSL